MSRVFTNGSGDWGSIPGRVIPKTKKMVLYTAFLNAYHYKVQIKGKCVCIYIYIYIYIYTHTHTYHRYIYIYIYI